MSKISARILSSLITLSLLTVCHPSVYAQTQNTGAIQGRVFEVGSLAPLPDAVVTITNEQIEYSRTTLTAKDGTYLVQILPAGTYRITAQKQGYENDSDPRNSTITNFLIHITKHRTSGPTSANRPEEDNHSDGSRANTASYSTYAPANRVGCRASCQYRQRDARSEF
jgi:hypothetical protein